MSLAEAAEHFADALVANAPPAQVARLGRRVLAACSQIDVSNEQAQAHAQAVAADVMRRLEASAPASLRRARPASEFEALLADVDDVAELMALVASLVEHQGGAVARLDDNVSRLDVDVERSRDALEHYRRDGAASPSLFLRTALVCAGTTLLLVFLA